MNELLKILSEIFKEENIKENKDKFKNLKELYHFCVSKGYTKDISVFESDYKKLVEEYSKTLELSDSDLESISGGVNNTFKSSVAMLMTALSLSGSASNMVSAASNNYANQNSITQKTSDWIKSKYNTVSEKTTEWLKARSKNEITVMKAIGGTLGLGLGLGLVSVPVIALASKNSNNYKNVQTLVFLLKNSESYKKTSESRKLSLIKKVYSELGIQIDKQKEISTDIQTVQNNLALTIKTKIKSLCELDKNHKDIKILTSLLQLMQSPQINTQGENNEHSKNDTQLLSTAQNIDNTLHSAQVDLDNDENSNSYDNVKILIDLIKDIDRYIKEPEEKKLSSIKEAYLELGIQNEQQKTIATDINVVYNNLNSMIKQKIENSGKLGIKCKEIEILEGFYKTLVTIPRQMEMYNVNQMDSETLLNKATSLINKIREGINNYKISTKQSIKSGASKIEDCLDWLDETLESMLLKQDKDSDDVNKIYKMTMKLNDCFNNLKTWSNLSEGSIAALIGRQNDTLQGEYLENTEFEDKDSDDVEDW